LKKSQREVKYLEVTLKKSTKKKEEGVNSSKYYFPSIRLITEKSSKDSLNKKSL